MSARPACGRDKRYGACADEAGDRKARPLIGFFSPFFLSTQKEWAAGGWLQISSPQGKNETTKKRIEKDWPAEHVAVLQPAGKKQKKKNRTKRNEPLEAACRLNIRAEEIKKDSNHNSQPTNEVTMKTVTIYTDGACSGNPGPGGWCAILEYAGQEKMISGGEANTTNNRMELTAVIAALEALKEPCAVELYSDSKYVIDALEKGWARGWRARGWVKADKKPALNPDLWQRLLTLCAQHTLRYHWVKGHAANEKNNRCDKQAVLESQRFQE